MSDVFLWDLENKFGFKFLILFEGCCKVLFFRLKISCFILIFLLCYFKVLCENFNLYFIVKFLKYKNFLRLWL